MNIFLLYKSLFKLVISLFFLSISFFFYFRLNTHLDSVRSAIKNNFSKKINNIYFISDYLSLKNKKHAFKTKEEQLMLSYFTLTSKLKKEMSFTPTPIKTPIQTTTGQSQPENNKQDRLHINQQKEIFEALNIYRKKMGKTPLSWSENLGDLAQNRANTFASRGGLDGHAGFKEFLDNKGYIPLGFSYVGENSAYGYNISPTEIIEKAFGEHPPHNDNQLDSKWTSAGIGANGTAVDVVFGK